MSTNSINSTPKALQGSKKRALSSPADQHELKKPKHVVDSSIMEETTMSEQTEITTTMNVTLTQDQIDQMTLVLKDTFEQQMASMVSNIVDGVLGGLKDRIHTLEEENINLKCKVEALESKADRAEQYSRRNCLRLSGIPEEKGESVDSIVMNIASAIEAN